MWLLALKEGDQSVARISESYAGGVCQRAVVTLSAIMKPGEGHRCHDTSYNRPGKSSQPRTLMLVTSF